MKKEDCDICLDLRIVTWICMYHIQFLFLLCRSKLQSWSNLKVGTSFWQWATKPAHGHTDSLELATTTLKGQDQTRPVQFLVWNGSGSGQKLKHRKLCLNIRKTFILLQVWPNTGICYPWRMWSLPPWKYPKAIWTQSSVTCSRWSCLSKKAGPDNFQRSFPTSASLWFCEEG